MGSYLRPVQFINKMKVFASTALFLSMLAAPAANASLVEVATNRKFGAFVGAKGTDDECWTETVAFMLCVPDCTTGCIVQSALSTDWRTATPSIPTVHRRWPASPATSMIAILK